MIRENIEAKLRSSFAPEHLEVINESYRHNVPAGSESHFKVVVVSEHFSGEKVISRHRAIYGVLAEELADSVHALALHTYTPKEWNDLKNAVPSSPPCGGAGLTI
ncbi:transcriptional regulator BolA [Pectobacteriaceae bacterium CE70]|uniref:DNA-binding transcriptional regulator BolA n=1 Tax=Serratia sp. (strain ATCC 39006) TaxID=104623 RepID=A0A2I5TN88_SERS3|nr:MULTISPECIES: transcriptional regulator BolA [Enterobacterales]WJV63669.1 transcriptional regulator BolA [Pectobacteriaceae bacterium C52]WJV68062.1 transcriptional regulator BolA [Pectobacteriaceae bacterium CE70]WJY12003.1 transcriptional regulator BolA [Pectobacteriaceae bacterium C80]AUH01700.1 BolA family transcriptional regulator [Serratia sp. ATCC 39006]AUH06023.1 BolA family transcriptional regulator [Serratia sp. ATCC 39006]